MDWHENYAGQGGIIKETSTIEHLDDLFAALASLIKKVGRFLEILSRTFLFVHPLELLKSGSSLSFLCILWR